MNQSLCTLARELPNLSLVGYWWHYVFPDAIRQVMAERLAMLPLNKQIGFFSDAYCIEWTYGKILMVRKLLAQVLAGKVSLGQYTWDEAVDIASELCKAFRDSSVEQPRGGKMGWLPTLLGAARPAMAQVVDRWIRFAGAAGKAA